MLAASDVPITQIVAKPPKARDPAEIAKLMSQVEKNSADRPIEERRKEPEAEFADVSEGGDGFVPGNIDISAQTAVEWVLNHDIALPADVRIFAQNTLEFVMRGKYQRKLARMTGRMVEDGQKVLDLGAGVGFLSIHTAKLVPRVTVVAQDDNASRLAIMRKVLDHNGINLGDKLCMTSAQVIFEDPAETVARINQLIADEKPDVLRISYAELGAKLLGQINLGSVRRIVLFGPAVTSFHQDARNSGDPSLTPSEDLSVPEFVIIEPKRET